MRNDYSRERRRWDAISSRQRNVDHRAQELFGFDADFIIMDEEWPAEKPEPRRVVVNADAGVVARSGKAERREQKRQRMQERIAEAQRRAHNEQNLGWGGW